MRFIIIVEWLSSDGGFRSLPQRNPDRDVSTVEVEAATVSEAHIIAAQMVACRPGINPTRTWRDPQ